MSEESKTVNDSFCLAEYDALRREIEHMLDDSRAIERNAVFAVGATWAWLAVHIGNLPKAIWWMPVFLTVLGSYRSWALLKTFGLMSDYIQEIERHFYGDEASSKIVAGWERFSRKRKHWISQTGALLWILMFVTTVGVAVLAHCVRQGPSISGH
jgi:hypothetical protein